MKLNGIMIGSENPKPVANYYAGLFGKPAMDQGGFMAWEMDGGMVVVGPHDQVKGKNMHPGRLMWGVESSDAKADFERLKASGASVARELYQDEGSGMWVATFSDPDNNYFQLVQM
jgi:predicted enzyme related to lactoylglutathione lyase